MGVGVTTVRLRGFGGSALIDGLHIRLYGSSFDRRCRSGMRGGLLLRTLFSEPGLRWVASSSGPRGICRRSERICTLVLQMDPVPVYKTG